MSKPSDVVPGTLDLLLWKVLALEPLNGFAVSRRLPLPAGHKQAAISHVVKRKEA